MAPIDAAQISRRALGRMAAIGTCALGLPGLRVAHAAMPVGDEALTSLSATDAEIYLRSIGLQDPCSPAFGTFERPFHQKSLWNSRPLGAVLGADRVPTENEVPWLQDDAYSASRYRGTPADPGQVVLGRGDPFVWVADEGVSRAVQVPHFPPHVEAPSGTDGHCEIVDEASGLIHAFYRLAFVEGAWRADKYSCLPLYGTGWGHPQCPDGSRAAGISTIGGLLLAQERGMDIIPHALAISTDRNAIRSGPIFPATEEDGDGRTDYAGTLPLGSLLMLPQDFPEDRLYLPETRAIARTLAAYGGYLVDRTSGTFGITCELASGWNAHDGSGRGGWDEAHHRDLSTIRDNLRRVVRAEGWIDGEGREFTPPAWRDMNLLSMRGPWTGGEGAGRFDTAARAYLFEASPVGCRIEAEIRLRSDRLAEPWNQWKRGCWYVNPEVGRSYRLSMRGHGPVGATLSFTSANGRVVFVSRRLGCGDSQIIDIPPLIDLTRVTVDKEAGDPASVRLELVGC